MTNNRDISSEVVIITGASKGVGRKACELLAKEGVNIAICARSLDKLKEIASKVNPEKIVYSAFDLSNTSKAKDFLHLVCRKFGRLDALVNNAAILGPTSNLCSSNLDSFFDALSLNFTTPLTLIKEAIPYLRKTKGRIINLSTGCAMEPLPIMGAYCTTKAALTMLTRVTALEEPDITCVNFAPGVVDTDMQTQIRNDAVPLLGSPWKEYFSSLPHTKALLTPEQAGEVLAWLSLYSHHQWSGQMVDGYNKDVLERMKLTKPF